jgi:TP901 family phage tail tape measure protein
VSVSGIKAGKAFVLIESLDKTGPGLASVGQRFSKFEKITNRASQRIGTKAADFIISGFDKAGKSLEKLGNKLQSLGQGVLGGGLLAALPAGAALTHYASFDDAMKKVEARSRGTTEQMQALRKQAKDLGQDTSFTAVEVGELQAILAQKGFSRSEIFNQTPHILALARGAGELKNTMEDVTLSADLASSTLRQFGLGADQTQRVADVLTTAVNGSALTLQTLQDSLKYVGPIARELNMGLEETVALIGQLGNLGIPGSIAGTALRRVVLDLSQEAKQKELNKLIASAGGKQGIKFVDEKKNLLPIPKILFSIGEAIKDLGSAQKASILGQIFGQRGILAAMTLAPNANPVGELYEPLMESAGNAQRTMEKMDSGIGGRIRIFLSSIEAMQLAIGEALEGSVTKTLDGLTVWVNQISQCIDSNKDFIINLTVLAGELMLFGVGLIAGGMAIKFVGTGLVALSYLFTALKITLLALTSPLGLATLAFGGLLVGLYKFNSRFRTEVDNATGFVSQRFSEIKQTISGSITGISQAISAGDFGLAFDIAATGIQLAWEQATDSLYDAWEGFVNFFDDGFMAACTGIQSTWRGIYRSMTNDILNLAENWSLFSRMVLGVDAGKESKRSAALEEQRQKFLAKLREQGVNVGNAEPQDTYQQIRDKLDAKMARQQHEPWDNTGEYLRVRNEEQQKRNAERDKRIADQKERLAKLNNKAAGRQDELDQAFWDKAFQDTQARLLADAIRKEKKLHASVMTGDLLTKANSGIGTNISPAVERGTLEAAKQGYENENRELFSKLVGINEAQLREQVKTNSYLADDIVEGL